LISLGGGIFGQECGIELVTCGKRYCATGERLVKM